MAKVLQDPVMVTQGGEADPSSIHFTYVVVDGDLKKHGSYDVSSPDFDQSMNTIWDNAITQIKTNEGIV